MLAHELRNPLAPIRNVGYMLSKGGAEPATVRRSGQMIERQASQLRISWTISSMWRVSPGAGWRCIASR